MRLQTYGLAIPLRASARGFHDIAVGRERNEVGSLPLIISVRHETFPATELGLSDGMPWMDDNRTPSGPRLSEQVSDG